MSDLFKKLKESQKRIEKSVKANINPDSPFGLLTDEEIALVLAMRAKKIRVSQDKTQSEFRKSANLSAATTYSNFEQKGSISLINFIKVTRGLGRMSELENLFKSTVEDKINSLNNKEKQRVRKQKKEII